MNDTSSRPPGVPYHHGRLREALIAAALEMLNDDSGEGLVSLRAVARVAEVSPNAPYRHFPDKAALLAAVAARGFGLLRAKLETVDAKAKPARAVAAQGAAYVRFALSRPALFRLMFGPQKGIGSSELVEAGDAAYAVLSRRMARLYPSDRALARRVLACWSTMHGFATLAIDGRVADKGAPEAVIAELLTLGPTSVDRVDNPDKPAARRRSG